MPDSIPQTCPKCGRPLSVIGAGTAKFFVCAPCNVTLSPDDQDSEPSTAPIVLGTDTSPTIPPNGAFCFPSLTRWAALAVAMILGLAWILWIGMQLSRFSSQGAGIGIFGPPFTLLILSGKAAQWSIAGFLMVFVAQRVKQPKDLLHRVHLAALLSVAALVANQSGLSLPLGFPSQTLRYAESAGFIAFLLTFGLQKVDPVAKRRPRVQHLAIWTAAFIALASVVGFAGLPGFVLSGAFLLAQGLQVVFFFSCFRERLSIPTAIPEVGGDAAAAPKPSWGRQALVTSIFTGGSILCYVTALASPALEGDGSRSVTGLTCLLFGWMSLGDNQAWFANFCLFPALFLLMARGLSEPPAKRQTCPSYFLVVILAGLALALSLGALDMKGFAVPVGWGGQSSNKWPITSIGPGCYLWIASILFIGMGAVVLILRDLLNLKSTGRRSLLVLGGVSAVALSVASLAKYEKSLLTKNRYRNVPSQPQGRSAAQGGVSRRPSPTASFTGKIPTLSVAQFTNAFLPTNGLVAWFPFNSTVLDESGNDLHATNHGARFVADRFGIAERALRFDGKQYVDCGTNRIFELGEQGTLACWMLSFQPTGPLIGKDPFRYHDDVQLGIDPHDRARGKIALAMSPKREEKIHVATGPTATPGRWYHVLGQWDKNGYRLFINGKQVASGSGAHSVHAAGHPLLIGRFQTNRFFRGIIDDVAIYDRALSGDEVESLHRYSELALWRHSLMEHGIDSTKLSFNGSKLEFGLVDGHDLRPLTGIPLNRLYFVGSPVTNLTPLVGMPLEHINLHASPKLKDLSPLSELPLNSLILDRCTGILDLSPLKNLKLRELDLNDMLIADLAPIGQMKVTFLRLENCRQIATLKPLLGNTSIETLVVHTDVPDIEVIRSLPNLKKVGFTSAKLKTPEQFWEEYDLKKKH